jgi:renalase
LRAAKVECRFMINEVYDVVVIGAGISGLFAAGKLRTQGFRVLVIDKGRGVGGRVSRRRFGDVAFDHGAQHFTARTSAFIKIVDEWEKLGIVKVWSTGFLHASGKIDDDGDRRYCGVGGMTSIPKYLAQGIDIRFGCKVDHVEIREKTLAVSIAGETVLSRGLVLTLPAPQSLQLLASINSDIPNEVRSGLQRIVYDPCIALMAHFPTSSLIPDPGGIWLAGEPIAWMADNKRKGASAGVGTPITIHAGPRFSSKNWEASDESIGAAVLGAAAPWLNGDPVEMQVHRWRYSRASRVHADPCLVLPDPNPIVFAGDGFGGNGIEGAALSGLAAGSALRGLISQGHS